MQGVRPKQVGGKMSRLEMETLGRNQQNLIFIKPQN